MTTIIQDLRFSIRLFLRKPGFFLVAVLTLALGIGVNTVFFSGVNAILFQPLPYAESGRTLMLRDIDRNGDARGVSHPDFQEWRIETRSAETLAGFRNWDVNFQTGQFGERLDGCLVTDGFFRMLGIAPHLGRTLQPEDELETNPRTVVLGHAFWQRRFSGDASVVGKIIRLNGEEFIVVGVMPKHFQFPTQAQCWSSYARNTNPAWLKNPKARQLQVMARLKTGATTDGLESELTRISRAQFLGRNASTDAGRISAQTLNEAVLGRFKEKNGDLLLILQGATLFVLLIACANLSNLMLAAAASREREIAIRRSLGAGRFRVVRQLLTETGVITLCGAVGGLAFTVWGLGFLNRTVQTRLPRAGEIGIDPTTLVFTLGLSVATGLAFGLFPALIISRSASLRDATGSSSVTLNRSRFGRALIIGEVALTVMLLSASGLMIRTFQNLNEADPGFTTDGVLTVGLTLPEITYRDPAQVQSFYRETVRRLAALPEVESVGAIGYPPLIGYNPGAEFQTADQPAAPGTTLPRVDYQPVTPGYFEAMRINRREGRALTEADLQETATVAVVNETLARRFFPDGNALGRRVRLTVSPQKTDLVEIVGIVGDVRQFGVATEPRPEIYVPGFRSTMTVFIKTKGHPGKLLGPVTDLVNALDPNLTPTVKSLETMLSDSIQKQRILGNLLGFLGISGLFLATLGIHGVIAYATSQRTREFGIRLALGARARDVLTFVLSQGLRLSGIGILIGLAGSVVFLRALRRMLYGVSPSDPLTLGSVTLLLVFTALLATWLPARKAARIQPVESLRHE